MYSIKYSERSNDFIYICTPYLGKVVNVDAQNNFVLSPDSLSQSSFIYEMVKENDGKTYGYLKNNNLYLTIYITVSSTNLRTTAKFLDRKTEDNIVGQNENSIIAQRLMLTTDGQIYIYKFNSILLPLPTGDIINNFTLVKKSLIESKHIGLWRFSRFREPFYGDANIVKSLWNNPAPDIAPNMKLTKSVQNHFDPMGFLNTNIYNSGLYGYRECTCGDSYVGKRCTDSSFRTKWGGDVWTQAAETSAPCVDSGVKSRLCRYRYDQDYTKPDYWQLGTWKDKCCSGNQDVTTNNQTKMKFDKCKMDFDHIVTWTNKNVNSQVSPRIDSDYPDNLRNSETEKLGVAWYPWSRACDFSNVTKDFCSQVDTLEPAGMSRLMLNRNQQCKNWESRMKEVGKASVIDDIRNRYCEENSQDEGCADYCLNKNLGCYSKMLEFCQKENLETPVCRRFCRNDGIDCNDKIKEYCRVLTDTNQLEINKDEKDTKVLEQLSNRLDLCGCFMPSYYMENYWNSLEKLQLSPEAKNDLCSKFPIGDPRRKEFECDVKRDAYPIPRISECFYRPCASSSALRPYPGKIKPACPNITQCIQTVNFDISGSGKVIGNINIDQKAECGGLQAVPEASSCTGNQYFSSDLKKCVECPVNSTVSNDKLRCYENTPAQKCSSGQILKNNVCEYCPQGSIPTSDRTSCQSCPFDSTSYMTDSCKKIECKDNQIIQNRTCITCPSGFSAIKSLNECQKCPDGFASGTNGVCVDCSYFNRYPNVTQSACLLSKPGFKSTGVTSVKCPDGYISDEFNNRQQCIKCSPGYTSVNNVCVVDRKKQKIMLISFTVCLVLLVFLFIISKRIST